MSFAIETVGLTKSYGTARGVEELTMSVAAGEVFGFLGPNGAGKTTTIRALMGLQRPTGGTARVLGMDPWTRSVDVHRRVGYLPGELALFARMTGRQHVQRFLRLRGTTGSPDLESLVERFEVDLDRPVSELSKGNRQKVGLVLALAHRPELLVLDEPTSGLDPLMQDEFERLLREVAGQGRTVFLSSHELDEVQRVADRVAIIKEGRLVVVDTVESLRRSAPQTIVFRFARPVDVSSIRQVPGVARIDEDGAVVKLDFQGPVGPLLRTAGALDPVEMTAHHADLDELFLRFYREGDADRAP